MPKPWTHGVAIFIVVFGFNILGDALDPRDSRQS
jgi:ABC-type dipeptide/oligopeptide/nickel transport system permease subunit